MEANLCGLGHKCNLKSLVDGLEYNHRANTTKTIDVYIQNTKQKQFTLDHNGYCNKNSGIRPPFMESANFFMDHIPYCFLIVQYICSIFNGFLIRYHWYNLDILRISRER